MVYTRSNPTDKTIYWSISPDGSRMLTLCPGHYSEENAIFKTKEALSGEELKALEKSIQGREPSTPKGAPVLILAGSGDYSLAPVRSSYPRELLKQWEASGFPERIRFATLSDYLEPVAARIKSGAISIPSFHGGTAYKFDAFWIENNEVKTLYRKNEQQLQAAETLATIASLKRAYEYPAKALSDAWILMCLNMDRNTLWGSAGGMVFVSQQSWDVQDRFRWVEATTHRSIEAAGASLLAAGHDVGLFNPLNWKRNDPVALPLPPGTTIEGVPSEALPDGSVLSQVKMPSLGIEGRKLVRRPAPLPTPVDLPEVLETNYYSIRIDHRTGALVSLKFRKSGVELLGGPANVIVAQRPIKTEAAPADFMAPAQGRTQLASSSDSESKVSLTKGPVAYSVTSEGKFYGGGTIRRVVRVYHDHPRIDFETELNDIPTYTVIVAKFPLAADIAEVRRGIPYGFSHGAWASPNPNLHGWTRGIVPAVRWIDYSLSQGGGVAIFDRGLTGRELTERTPMIFLLNAEDKYHGFPNAWLTGEGKHLCPYSILPHEGAWDKARVPHMAWEYNLSPVCLSGRTAGESQSFLETSDNIIVQAIRREGNHIELRFAECLGLEGVATVQLSLPHQNAILTDMVGTKQSSLPASRSYKFPVRPQQIVTMQFETTATLPSPEPVLAWDPFVPHERLAALHRYEPGLKGHPPFGDGVDF
jgi:alpha-mannosidase